MQQREDRRPKTENRWHKIGDRRQEAEDRKQKRENKRQKQIEKKTKDKRQKTKEERQKTEKEHSRTGHRPIVLKRGEVGLNQIWKVSLRRRALGDSDLGKIEEEAAIGWTVGDKSRKKIL